MSDSSQVKTSGVKNVFTELKAVEVSYYSTRLENRYLTSYGDNYENFVGDVLARRYPGDFLAVSSGAGDDKNDGIIRSTRELFQCYAPHRYSPSEVNRKLKEDYLGAIEHWDKYFDTWLFAWCHQKSSDPDKSTVKLILDLETENKKPIKLFKLENIISLALETPRNVLTAWLGAAPVVVEQLGFNLELREIKEICEAIAAGEEIPNDDEDMRPVPPTKLDYNRIPDEIRVYIEKGKTLAGRVNHLFSTDPDPLLGDKVAQRFTEEYELLRSRGRGDPAAVYWGLYDFIRHRLPHPVNQNLELAAHAVLSYLFARCNIFERPPEGWQGHQT